MIPCQYSMLASTCGLLRDCRKSLKMAILELSHLMISITYKCQNNRFRVFRQSLRIPEKYQKCRYARISQPSQILKPKELGLIFHGKKPGRYPIAPFLDPASRRSEGVLIQVKSTSDYWLLCVIRRRLSFALFADLKSDTYRRVNEWRSLVSSVLLLKIEELT